MRRPPDKDGHPVMSDRDVDSSNATLNTLFGGARQKSWMLGPGAPVRPTPRSTISKAPGNHATLAQKTMTAVLPSAAPSDEPSPILPHSTIANGVQNYNQRQIFSNENQRPGISGTQRPTITAIRPNEATAQPSPITQSQFRIPSSIPQPVRASRPSPVNTSAQPPRSNCSNPSLPSTSTAQNLGDGQATFRSAQELRSPSFPPISADQQQSRGSSEHPQSRNPFRTTSVTTQQFGQPLQGSREQLSSPSPVLVASSLEMAFEQPPLPSSVLLPTENQSNPSRSSVPSNPHKRQRTQVPMPPLKPRVALIHAHVESVGGIQYLNKDLERPRFQLLSEACNTEDSFYVALHQLFCVWDSPGRAVIANFDGIFQGFPATPVLAVAFKVLGQLIRDNEGLAPNHLKWFIDFPSPLANLVNTSEPYRKILINVGQFLSKLASDWAPLSRLCSHRGYPPLVDELRIRMGLLSPILQQIMFTATRRNLGVADDHYGEQMEKVFGQDKQGHQELAARINTGRPPSAKEIEARNRALIDKYLSINNQRLRVRRVSGPVIGSPLAGSPVLSGPTNLQHSVSNDSNGASFQPQPQNSYQTMNQNFPSPDAWHQNQQGQHGRRTSTSSPNPLLQAVVGRPPSVTGQRGYPSPTLLQGLSMNSPVVQSPVQQQQQQQGFQWSGHNPVLRSNSVQVQPTHNMMVFQNGNQTGIPSMSRPQSAMQPQQQLAMQQQQELQQLAAQQQQQLAVQNQQWQQQAQHTQQAQQEMQFLQHQQLEQQRQHMTTRQVLAMNRAAQLRSNNDAVEVQQRVHSRNNSASGAGRPAPIRNSPNVQLPRPLSSFNTLGPAAQNQAVQIYNSTQPLQRSLVPPLGFQQPSQPTNPDMTALHQAHVRSPRLVPEDFASELPEDDPSRRFYQSVKDFALGPIKIPVSSALSIFEFSISEASFALMSKDKVVGTDRLPIREFKRGSLQYRLRCITAKRDTTKCLVPDWIISDTVWPETVFLEINSQQLEVRRKNHHGKDLPIDVTRFVIPKTSPENVNRIKVSIPRLRKAMKDMCYFIAVEVIEVLQYPQIMEMCIQYQHILHSKTLDAIKKSLAPPPSEDDDDFAMVVSDLSIDLADPFTARIFEIPVRGSSCLHRECFDLETFLLTRNSKPKRPTQPSMIDVWKCPLCGRDARPYSLQIDDFLASVRAELARQDNLDAKAILISADGSWRAKVEPRPMKRKATGDLEDDDNDDSSDGEGTARKQQAEARTKSPHLNGGRGSKEVEVIELDDD